jgi:hypothetical protein
VRPGTPTTTVALPTATSYVIHPHAGCLDTQASAVAGPYWYAITADETGTVNAAHATWPRIDILWVRIDDPGGSDGSTVPAIVTGYTAGAAAAVPAAPATPARCMLLATIAVPIAGGGDPTVTWNAPYVGEMPFLLATRTASLNVATASSGDGTAVTWAKTVSAGISLDGSGVLTVSQAGQYAVKVVLGWAGGGTGDRLARVRVNGAGFALLGNAAPCSAATTVVVDQDVVLTAGGTLQVFARQNSGGTIAVEPTYTYLSVRRVR